MSQPNPFDRATLSTRAGSLQGPLFSTPHELVTIYVESKKKPFIIHNEVASYSPVFKAAFNSDLVEGQMQTYNLERTPPGIFQLLVQWLYTKSIQFCLTDAEIDSIPVAANGLRNCCEITKAKLIVYGMQLASLWVTADFLQMPGLQNLAIDALEQLRVQWGIIVFHALRYLYEIVPLSGARPRQLILEHCVLFLSHTVYQKVPHLFPKQMLVDLIVAQKVKEELKRAQLSQPDPFTHRAEFIKRFHVPEDV